MPIMIYSHVDKKKMEQLRQEMAFRNLCHDFAYDPNQPRDPKGSKTGGEWTSEGIKTAISDFDFSGVIEGKKIGVMRGVDVVVATKINQTKLKDCDVAVCIKGKNKGTVVIGPASGGHSEMVSFLGDNIDNYVRYEWSTQFKPSFVARTDYAGSEDRQEGFSNIYDSFKYLSRIGFTDDIPVLIDPTNKNRVTTKLGELEFYFKYLVKLVMT